MTITAQAQGGAFRLPIGSSATIRILDAGVRPGPIWIKAPPPEIEIVCGIPRIKPSRWNRKRPGNIALMFGDAQIWDPPIFDSVVSLNPIAFGSWKEKVRAVAVDPNASVTIAQYEREIWIYGGHHDGAAVFTNPNTRRVYLSRCETTLSDVDRWHTDNLPHYVEFNRGEPVSKAEKRRWIQQNTTGVFSLSWPANGVRFEKCEDAFWFKIAQT